ncbi:probable N-methylproline demethylase (stahydrine utilization protein stcD) [alpha proteobacterium BAL199]|jgi:N-methyl-L-proline demethylase|nr:probable N-methylproline demethylase (stahydrine utilization protein stcD) [alpha proteobacterium BAL199]
MTQSKDPLLQPYRLKHLVLKNRILSTAHEPAYSEAGMPTERYRLYHEEKAKGGIGLTMIGGSAIVDRDSPPAFGNLHIWDDAIVPWLRELADGVHAHGTAIMCQITHLGRRTSSTTGDWLPVIAPSPIREPAHRAFPKEAEDFDLERIAAAYGAAARRCRDGGLDGVEIEAYGHFLDGFWSPLTNKRTDRYGGSLDNRMRFGLEALAAIRDAVGPEFIVGIRMVVDEDVEAGLSEREGTEIARRLAAAGDIDFINVIKGHIDTDEGLSHVIPPMGTPAGPHLDLAGRIRAETGVAVFHAARINDVATARHAVAEGRVDLIGMTRAHIADPHIVAKIMAGQEDRIRPCVGAAYCIDRIYFGGEALCLHNPATGREATIPHLVPRSIGPTRRVVVVGAGPAGLEAARVSAERGHHVIVLEAAPQPGGQLRLATALPRRRELVGIVDWRVAELERLGVDLRCNIYAEADEVLAETPDVVIVATGGLPNTDFLSDGKDQVTTTWDILSGAAKPGERVLLFDDNGAHPGMTAAEFMAAAGSTLEIATPERVLAPELGGINYPSYFKAFARHDVRITLNKRLHRVRRDGNELVAELWDEYGRLMMERRVDQVVVEHGTLPLDELYFALKPGSINDGAVDLEALIAVRLQTVVRNPDGRFHLYRIGDAVASRNVHAAIYDATRLCMTF